MGTKNGYTIKDGKLTFEKVRYIDRMLKKERVEAIVVPPDQTKCRCGMDLKNFDFHTKSENIPTITFPSFIRAYSMGDIDVWIKGQIPSHDIINPANGELIGSGQCSISIYDVTAMLSKLGINNIGEPNE